ncbi:hypothetical protein B9479_003792 [Cryptococcus floricola]|uniref:Uncharacterized protein n=1 Tax=Cryptococcus floricola TaxID=2591691 RepID=A0A5D3AZP4_9TREE|nr:hypothetical protein B9479_003792 [Cryptococcus floricola]
MASETDTIVGERVSPGTIPGLFHSMRTAPEPGTIDMIDLTPDGEDWSFQPQASSDSFATPEANALFQDLCGSKVHYNSRRMQLVLPASICSRSDWGIGQDTNAFEKLPITMIQFEIPADFPKVEFNVHRDPDDGSVDVRVTDFGEEDEDDLETEVTCFHPVIGLAAPEIGSDTGLLYRKGDYYLSQERMTITSKIVAGKSRMDLIDHETMGHTVCDGGVPLGHRPDFSGDITLTRSTRDGDRVSLDLEAVYRPYQKSVTRPAATDDYSFVTMCRDDENSCSDVRFLEPARNVDYSVEPASEVTGTTGEWYTDAAMWDGA